MTDTIATHTFSVKWINFLYLVPDGKRPVTSTGPLTNGQDRNRRGRRRTDKKKISVYNNWNMHYSQYSQLQWWMFYRLKTGHRHEIDACILGMFDRTPLCFFFFFWLWIKWINKIYICFIQFRSRDSHSVYVLFPLDVCSSCGTLLFFRRKFQFHYITWIRKCDPVLSCFMRFTGGHGPSQIVRCSLYTISIELFISLSFISIIAIVRRMHKPYPPYTSTHS